MKNNISIQTLKKLSEKLMFRMEEKDYIDLQKYFETIFKEMEIVMKINTKNVKVTDFPWESESDFLRSDKVVSDNFSFETNAPKIRGKEIVVNNNENTHNGKN